METEQTVVFYVQWFDSCATLVKKFSLTYWLDEDTLQLVDESTKKTFLKKIRYPSVTFQELFIGNAINVYGRLLHIVGYADLGTKIFMEKHRQRAFILLRGRSALGSIGKTLTLISQAGYFVAYLKSVRLNADSAKKSNVDVEPGVAVALEVVSPLSKDCPTLWSALQAKLQDSLGVDMVFTDEDASKYSGFFFDSSKATTSAGFEEGWVTLGLIKPHIVKAGQAGAVLAAIKQAGFQLWAIEQFHLDLKTTTELLDVYKDILPHYRESIEHFTDGPTIAIQLMGEGVVEKFRDFCGPHAVDVAKILEPETLRAQYGVNRIQNVVHCTDLPDDAGLECRYFFQLLQTT